MADVLIAALAADCLIACALTAWAYLTDDSRTTDPTSVPHHPKHLRSTR